MRFRPHGAPSTFEAGDRVMSGVSQVATTTPSRPPVAYVLITIVGLAYGWIVGRFAGGARYPREFLAPPRSVDRLANVIADRFADRLLDDHDPDRVAKNAVAAAGLMLVWAVILIGTTPNAYTPLVVGGCIIAALLMLGEALIAYGASGGPILSIEP